MSAYDLAKAFFREREYLGSLPLPEPQDIIDFADNCVPDMMPALGHHWDEWSGKGGPTFYEPTQCQDQQSPTSRERELLRDSDLPCECPPLPLHRRDLCRSCSARFELDMILHGWES